MNRKAVVLAADSAVTLEYWDQGKRQERYHKSANKIFQLSRCEPIGLMIHDSADCLRVPWEVIAKEYRKQLAGRSFDTLEGYADDFFQFLNDNDLFFPRKVQEEVLIDAAENAAIRFCILHKIADGEEQDAYSIRFELLIAQRILELQVVPNVATITNEVIEQSLISYANSLREILKQTANFVQSVPAEPSEKLAVLGILTVLKEPSKWMSTTGMVFAGFGKLDIFPKMLEYQAQGVISSKLICVKKSTEIISHDVPASMTSFAQTSMIDTFMLGIGLDIYQLIGKSANQQMLELSKDVAKALGADIANIDDIDERVTNHVTNFRKSLVDNIKEEHGLPFRRVLGSLSIEEMCELAEILINLQSLKEKVTKPTASVGGPIDVASISKGEGLIWIKRKHYFDVALNPRFLQN